MRFTVQAYPDETFAGTVRQVRLQSTIQENVVNYTVVVDVDNPDGRLLPGMTATVDFVVAKATDVLKVANAALRFRPTEEMMAQLRARAHGGRAATARGRRAALAVATRPGGRAADQRPADRALLWYRRTPSGKVDARPGAHRASPTGSPRRSPAPD